jgi:hypothetical protein
MGYGKFRQCSGCGWSQPASFSWCAGCRLPLPAQASPQGKPRGWDVAFPTLAGASTPKGKWKKGQAKATSPGPPTPSDPQLFLACLPSDLAPQMREQIEANIKTQTQGAAEPSVDAPSFRSLQKSKDRLVKLERDQQAAAEALEAAQEAYRDIVGKVLDQAEKVTTMSEQWSASLRAQSAPKVEETVALALQRAFEGLAKVVAQSAMDPAAKKIMVDLFTQVVPPPVVETGSPAAGADAGGLHPGTQTASTATDSSMGEGVSDSALKRQRFHEEIEADWKRKRANSPAVSGPEGQEGAKQQSS